MTKTTIQALALLAPLTTLLACDSGGSRTQPITGKVTLSTFPTAPTSVRARRAGATDIVAPVGADGAFALALPAGKSYRLDFLAGDHGTRLVFPRQRGALDSTFEVKGAGPAVDVGAVRYLGDARKRTFAFSAAGVSAEMCAAAEELVDAQAGVGVVCVNDSPPDEGGSCGEVGEVGEASEGEGQGVGAVEPTSDEGEAWVGETAVAETNLPESLGCEGQGVVGPVDEEEGGGVGSVGTK